MTKRTLLVISGAVWLCVGSFLLFFGTHLVQASKTEYAFILLLAALIIGFLKGNIVLRKAAERQGSRIANLPHASLKNLYSRGYYLLLLSMVGLGWGMRFLPLTVRGTIDVAVGAALIIGATHLFRFKLVKEKVL